MFGCAVVLIGMPAYVVTVAFPATGHAAVCGDGQDEDCPDDGCPPDGECAPPPPQEGAPPVIVPVPRPNVNACVNLGGRRRVSVNACV